MPVWLLPALKAVIPHIGTILSTAAPVFTRKPADTSPNQNQLLQQQITELQTVALDNAAHIKELAAQIQTTVAALEEAAIVAAAKLKRVWYLCVTATGLSLLSVCTAVFVVVTRGP
ncbi:MAG: hypothetical protein H7Y02_02185 [Candidatus Obscuribacterales bacterium]|nr:hypothetical protein [Steroidobacteraceae bacterium]